MRFLAPIFAFCFLLSALAPAQTFTAYRTWFTHGAYYPADSLGYALFTDFQARTNGRGRAEYAGWHWVWNDYQMNTPGPITWNTNSLLFRNGVLATGATACVPWNEVAAPSLSLDRVTMLTRRIGVSAGHYWGQYSLTNPLLPEASLIFLGRSNALHTNAVQAVLGGTELNWTLLDTNGPTEDRYYYILSNALPADVETMRVVSPLKALTNINVNPLHPWLPAGEPQAYIPNYTLCHHGCLAPHNGFTHTEHVAEPTGWHVGGDSGSPAFIILSNECFYTGGWTYSYASEDLPKAIHTINVWLGLNTNSADNQLRYGPSLTNFPVWPYP